VKSIQASQEASKGSQKGIKSEKVIHCYLVQRTICLLTWRVQEVKESSREKDFHCFVMNLNRDNLKI
jgi:hypothetical protein